MILEIPRVPRPRRIRRETEKAITAVAVERSLSADSRRQLPGDERTIVGNRQDDDTLTLGVSASQRRRARLLGTGIEKPPTADETQVALNVVRQAVMDFPELVNVIASKLPSDAGYRLVLMR